MQLVSGPRAEKLADSAEQMVGSERIQSIIRFCQVVSENARMIDWHSLRGAKSDVEPATLLPTH